MLHLVILSHQQFYLVYKLVSIINLSLSDIAFCLLFTTQHVLIYFFSEFNFEFFTILFLMPYCHISELKSCYLSNIIVKRAQRTKLDSESFVNIYQFICYSYIVFKKNDFAFPNVLAETI